MGIANVTGGNDHAEQLAETRTKEQLVTSIASTVGDSASVASHYVELALPLLLKVGDKAAESALGKKLGPSNAKAVMSLLKAHVGSANSEKVGSADFYDDISGGAYPGFADNTKSGGCGCDRKFLGSDELDTSTVRDYANTANSGIKNAIIDEVIAAGLNLKMKITGDSQAERIKSMLSQLPTGDRIKSTDETHKQLCKGLAKAINHAHGAEVINSELPADVICQQVAEIISSLSSGMHTEFLSIYNDVHTVLKNLHILKSSLKDDHDAIVAKIRSSDDPLLEDQVATLNDLHNLILGEVDRQLSVLGNLLNVTLRPAEKELASLIKNEKDLHGYVEKINVKVGSERFGKVIADVLKNVGITANFALVIEKALKTVGLTLDEYAKNGSLSSLREKIVRNTMGKDLSDEQLREYLKAAELLYRNFYRSQDIAAAKTGSEDTMYDGSYQGAAEYPKSALDKRISDRKKLRNLIFDAFYSQLNKYFDQLIGSIDRLTMKVGTEIPLSEQLNGFRAILQRVDMEIARNKNVYYALIGYYNDAMSKSTKETLLADLRMVSSYIDTLIEMPLYSASKQYFTEIQSQIKAITDLIDKYSDEIAAKFGRGEESDPVCMQMDDKEGGDESVYGGESPFENLVPQLKYRSNKTIHDAVRQFDYKFRVAQIRENMRASEKELGHYAEKYDKIVASGIADVLTSEKKTYEKLRKHLTDKDLFESDDKYVVDGAIGFGETKDVAEQREAALKMLDGQWEVKKKFWATIEAVDQYMKIFTDALVKNPQDVKDIKSMLDDIDTVNDWYSDKTGNDLAGVFDNFPSYLQEDSLTSTGNVSTQHVVYPGFENPDGSHYYANIKAQLAKGNDPTKNINGVDDVKFSAYPGNPYLVTIPTKGQSAKEAAKKTLGGLSVLKNLISVFIHVGSKFGGEDIRKKVFMSPTQMYHNLIDYLAASAFTQGFGLGEFSSEELPDGFFGSNAMAVEMNLASGEIIGSSAFGVANPPFQSNNRNTYPDTTKLVHLGVTSADNVGISDKRSYRDLGTALVGKINAATGSLRNDLIAVPVNIPAQTANNEQKWLPDHNNTQRALLFKKRWGVWMRSILPGLKTQESFSFKKEDEYFVLILKSLAAKILTVTGLYDVFDRPMEFNGLSPIRMIIGGDMQTPKVDEGAVALYLRLPLLAQFYRNIFGYDGVEDPNNKYEPVSAWRAPTGDRQNIKISMVPDIDGVFAGLIRLIFRKNKYIKGEQYSEDDAKELIKEINLIYQRMQAKYPQNTVMETIHEFVAEINRRYGIVSKAERDEYEREFGNRYNTLPSDLEGPYREIPTETIAILPGETEDEVVRMSAAERLLGENFTTSTEKKSLYTIDTAHKDLVYKFRCAIDKYFEQPDVSITFNHAIKGAQLKLKHETNDEARFKIVCSLIRGVDINTKIDGMKYVLFHETVVGGLNVLSSMHSVLSKFKRRIHAIDLGTIENQIWEYLNSVGPKNMTDLCTHVVNYLKTTLGLTEANDNTINQLINKVFGIDEKAIWNGGDSNANVATFNLKRDSGIPQNDIPRMGPLFARKWTVGTPDAFGTKCTVDDTVFSYNAAGTVATGPGLSSVLIGYSVKQLQEAHRGSNADAGAKNAANTFMRFIFGREFVMKELTESLLGLGVDFQGLVDVKINDGKINLNYGGLKTLIEDMFQHVSYFLDMLRPHIRQDIIEQYTSKTRAGSFYWLQEQLMEKIIMGRRASADKTKVEYASIDELVRKLDYTFHRLTQSWNVDGGALSAAGGVSRVRAADPNYKVNNFDKVFAEMIFYDASKPASGLIRSKEADDVDQTNHTARGGLKVVDYMHNPYESLHLFGPQGTKTLDTRFACRFKQLYSWGDEFTLNRSALFAFNQLIAKYIQSFYDPISGKIYGGVINQFANGSFNRAVADQLHTFPDTAPMFFIKNAAGEYKIPNNVTLATKINPDDIKYVDMLRPLIMQYLDLGVKVDQSVNERRRLLSFEEKKTNTNLTIANGGQNKTPILYINLLAHIIGKVIFDLFKMHSGLAENNAVGANGYTQGEHNLLTLGPLPIAVNIGDCRALYNGDRNNNNVTIKQIMNKINAGGTTASLVVIINAVCVNHSSLAANGVEFKTPAAGSPLSTIFGANGAINNVYRAFDSADYGILLYELLSLTANFNARNEYGSILSAAIEVYPFSTDSIGTSHQSSRVDTFCNILARCKTAYNAALLTADQQKSFNDAKKEIEKDTQSNVKVYSAPTSGVQPIYNVKQDDLYLVGEHDIDTNDISSAASDVNHLVLARNGPVNGALPANNLADLKLDAKQSSGNSDDIDNLKNFGQRADPDGDHILFTSLSVVLKNLTTSKVIQNQSLVYIQDNVADIALYMKEKMRANLPAFRNLFKELVNRCEFIKRLINQRDVSLKREWTANGAVPSHNPWPHVLLPVTATDADTKHRFTSIIDGIMKGCNSFITSCEQVLKEIGDDPKYFELNQNSIKDYKSQYGVDPLMPLSSTLAVLKNIDKNNELDFFPIHALGDDQFKLMYGTRSLIGQPTAQPLMEHNPGFSGIIDNFNLTIDGKMQVDKSKADSFMKLFAKSVRYFFELKHIKGLLTPHIMIDHTKIHPNNLPIGDQSLFNDGSFIRTPLINNDQNLVITNKSDVSINSVADLSVYPTRFTLPVYSIMKSLSDTIKLTESSFKDEKIKELVDYISGGTKKATDLEIQNIVDLNIVPINVHALMRDIPLANLYNYAYTFDRLIIELYYGLRNTQAEKMIRDLCGEENPLPVASAKDMLVHLLLNPYKDLFNGESGVADNETTEIRLYDKFAKAMMSGAANNGELGRPKFLSDQILNKAVFGELYTNYDEYNEMGPSAASALRNKISMNDVIKTVVNLSVGELKKMNDAGKFADLLLDEGTYSPDDFKNYCTAITKYISQNPRVSIPELISKIKDKFLNVAKGIREFKGHCYAQTDAAFAQLAAVSAMVIKFAYNQVSELANKNSIDNVDINTTAAAIVDDFDKFNNNNIVNNLSGVRLIVVGAANINGLDYPTIRHYVAELMQTTSKHYDSSLTRTNNSYKESSNNLHWLEAADDNSVDDNKLHSVDVTSIKSILTKVGRLRFDTVFIRNLIFIVNLYRSVRMKLQRDLTYNKDIIIKSAPITRVQLTEFFNNEVDRPKVNYNDANPNIWERYNY